MGNAYPSSSRGRYSGSPPVRIGEAEGWSIEEGGERTALLEENARLRALVVKLSDLVLRNVVDQNGPKILPARLAE